MTERYERHRQTWTQEEIQKLHLLATKGMSLKAIAKALTRSEESTKNRAKLGPVEIHRVRIIVAPIWIMASKLVSVLQARIAIRLNSLSF